MLKIIRPCIFAIAVLLIAAGLWFNDQMDVLIKATMVCLDCMGIG